MREDLTVILPSMPLSQAVNTINTNFSKLGSVPSMHWHGEVANEAAMLLLYQTPAGVEPGDIVRVGAGEQAPIYTCISNHGESLTDWVHYAAEPVPTIVAGDGMKITRVGNTLTFATLAGISLTFAVSGLCSDRLLPNETGSIGTVSSGVGWVADSPGAFYIHPTLDLPLTDLLEGIPDGVVSQVTSGMFSSAGTFF